MNESAVRLEEQIISLFPTLKTEVYQGWILKHSYQTIVYPLYGSFDKNIAERIQACEAISRQKSLNCRFRIVEHTNYYLAARLEDCGYKLHHSYIVGEWNGNRNAILPGQNLNRKAGTLKAVLRKEAGENITEKIVADNGSVVGIKRQELLYLPKGKLPYGVDIGDIFQYASDNHISRILVNIPENEELLAYYRKSGFHKAYLYRCYQKEHEEKSSKEQEN